MAIFLQTIVAGLLKGGLYALIGIGMTLIMGVMGIINLAHGQMMMLAMYITFVLNMLGVDPYFSLLVAMPALFVIGVLIQKFLLNPLIKVETILPHNMVLMTVGIGMVLTEIVRFVFKSDYKYVKTSYSSSTFFLGGISFNVPLTIAFFIAVAFTVAIFWFLVKTDLGRSIRATAQDKDAATLMGVNTGRITVVTMGLGAALVAAAGTCSRRSTTSSPTSGAPSPRRPSSSPSWEGSGPPSARSSAGSPWGWRKASGPRTSGWSTRTSWDSPSSSRFSSSCRAASSA